MGSLFYFGTLSVWYQYDHYKKITPPPYLMFLLVYQDLPADNGR